MGRGRPVKSPIRQNVVEILYFLEQGYAYEIYKIYKELFPEVTMRSVYYHLKKGLATKEFVIKEVKKESGNYSWGPEAEKIYYGLGPAAKPAMEIRVKEFLDKRSKP